ncbi:recombinase family protein [Candidatus Peribacteria bacterium]|nr:recombinase family protein [Candidatus Peribacteria bacterium]
MKTILLKRAISYYRSAVKTPSAIDMQRNCAWVFAQEHGIEIIHEEADIGQSGLSINRPGLTNIFQNWILNGDAPTFDYVLIYDFSRWGRFRDLHAVSDFELLCTLHGRRVIYVAKFLSSTFALTHEQLPPLVQ